MAEVSFKVFQWGSIKITSDTLKLKSRELQERLILIKEKKIKYVTLVKRKKMAL